jgi:hypothetical protein
VSAIDEVINAFQAIGWTVGSERVGRGPNPTRLDLQRGRKQRLSLLAYAWRITGEGKGRSGTNFRIQTTRTHNGPLLSEHDRLTLGFGIDAGRDVIAAFDGWTKRNTGASSSVHIKRQLLDDAQANGLATSGPPWDSRVACRKSEIDRLLPWIDEQGKPRASAVHAVDFQWHGESTATVSAKLWDSAPAAWLRAGDHLVAADPAGERLLDNSIWTVRELDVQVSGSGRYPLRLITFGLQRYGRVENEAQVLGTLNRKAIHDRSIVPHPDRRRLGPLLRG